MAEEHIQLNLYGDLTAETLLLIGMDSELLSFGPDDFYLK